MIRQPLFIVFEGIDGSGKSTQAAMLNDYFNSNNINSTLMMEPTDGKWGREIRNILKGDVVPPAEEQLKLFLQDREDDAENNIRPALESLQSIVMDRYYYSNAAYQGAMGLDPELILEENKKRNFPEPDRIYFIDILPEAAMERISIRNGSAQREIFEKQSFLEKVRDIFISMKDDKCIPVDGSGSAEDIHKKIIEDIINTFA